MKLKCVKCGDSDRGKTMEGTLTVSEDGRIRFVFFDKASFRWVKRNVDDLDGNPIFVPAETE